MGRFSDGDAERLLIACHRRCCICHKFCGVKMELDHIRPAAAGGSDDIENAIALCFDCHAEVHHYNDRHPRGRKFSESEIRGHKEQWLRIASESPASLVDAPRFGNPGPLEAILWELHLNRDIAQRLDPKSIGCPFELGLTRAAMSSGTLLTLPEEASASIRAAFVAMGAANSIVTEVGSTGHQGHWANVVTRAQESVFRAKALIADAINQLERL